MNMNIIKTFILIVLPVIGYSQTLTRLNLAQLAQSGATDGQYIKWDNASSNWVPATVTSSGGTVTSVGLSLPSIFTVTVSPITSSGTLTATLANQNANLVFAGPSTGAAAAPTFRSLVAADIPALPYVPTSRTLTINGTALDLSANRSWSVGTVTSVAALTLGTTGTDVSSNVANGTTTPVITLNIPTASATNRGALSSTDWTTFNNKQSAISLTTTGSSGSATFISNVLNVPTYTLAGLGGFANPMTTLGDIIYGGTSGAPTRLAGNTAAQVKFLAQTGTGSASAAPVWTSIDSYGFVYGLGRAGGQLIYGGTSAGEYIALQGSTAESEHDKVILNYYGGNVALGGGDNLVVPLRFMEANSSGTDTNFIALKAPTTITSNVTFTLPTTDGTANQVLKTDGSGNLGWANASSISGTTNRIPYFNTSTTLSSSGLTWDNTNSKLGINFTSPSATLQVSGTSDNANTYSLYIGNQSGTKVLNFDNSGKVGINVSSPATTLHFNGSMSRKAPVRTGVATAYTVLDDDSWIIVNNASSTVTLTLPTAANFQGRELMIKNVSAIAVNSASSNVIAITTNPGSNPPTTTTSILPATAGKWATLVSVLAGDLNWYWAIMQAN